MLKVANSVINASQIKTPITFAGDVTLSTGNLVIGTAGKGIDFTATTSGSGTMTSELFSDYEEGTWTPVLSSAVGSITAYTAGGKYTKIGNQVFLYCYLYITNGGTASGIGTVTGLPFTSAPTTVGGSNSFLLSENNVSGIAYQGSVSASSTNFVMSSLTGSVISYSNGTLYITQFGYITNS